MVISGNWNVTMRRALRNLALKPSDAADTPSVTWKLHREILLPMGWGRAVLLQIAHPLVAAGVGEHSSFRNGWAGRLYRTLEAMLKMTFGTPEESASVAQSINAAHDRVNGRLSEAAGGFPAGTRYSAHDPHLLRWVHGTLVDSCLLLYELYVGSLTLEEKDRYCAEASGIEPLLRIPKGYLPRSVAELQSYMDAMFQSGEIVVTDMARDLARDIVAPSVPSVVRPMFWGLRLPTIGLLPPSIRKAYGFSWSALDEAALRSTARLSRTLLPLTPSLLRHWPHARTARRRTERAS